MSRPIQVNNIVERKFSGLIGKVIWIKNNEASIQFLTGHPDYMVFPISELRFLAPSEQVIKVNSDLRDLIKLRNGHVQEAILGHHATRKQKEPKKLTLLERLAVCDPSEVQAILAEEGVDLEKYKKEK